VEIEAKSMLQGHEGL